LANKGRVKMTKYRTYQKAGIMTKYRMYKRIKKDLRKRNIKLILSRLCDIAIGLLAGIAFISAVYYLSIWRW